MVVFISREEVTIDNLASQIGRKMENQNHPSVSLPSTTPDVGVAALEPAFADRPLP